MNFRSSIRTFHLILLTGCLAAGFDHHGTSQDARSSSLSFETELQTQASITLEVDSEDSGNLVLTLKNLSPSLADSLVELAKQNPDWADFFTVRIVNASAGEMPPVVGRYRWTQETLEFRPLFPFAAGQLYQAVFQPPDEWSLKRIQTKFFIPAQPLESIVFVKEVYPTSNTLPENLLKFYVHFSAPVRQGRSYDYVKLLDANGEVMESSILKLDQELWNPEGTRLTLLLDPGRIKQGLVPNQELGQILEAGKTYTLLIDQRWPDLNGNPLVSEVRKTFTATEADHESPSPDAWTVSLPQPGTRDELIVKFPDPMDEAILQRALWIENPQGETVLGSVAISNEETVWTFTPSAEWELGVYQLAAHNSLEDRSGNSVGRPFEVMQGERPQDIPEVFKRALIIGN